MDVLVLTNADRLVELTRAKWKMARGERVVWSLCTAYVYRGTQNAETLRSYFDLEVIHQLDAATEESVHVIRGILPRSCGRPPAVPWLEFNSAREDVRTQLLFDCVPFEFVQLEISHNGDASGTVGIVRDVPHCRVEERVERVSGSEDVLLEVALRTLASVVDCELRTPVAVLSLGSTAADKILYSQTR